MQLNTENTFRKDVLHLVSGTGIAQLIGVLASPIITRIFPATAFGTAAMISSIVSILLVFGCLQYEHSIVLAKSDSTATNLLFSSLIIAVAVSVLSGFMILGLLHSKAVFSMDASVVGILWIVPIALFVDSVFNAFSYWSTRKRQFRSVAIARISNNGFAAASKIAGGTGISATAMTLVLSQVGGRLVASAVLFFQYWQREGKKLVRSISLRHSLAALKRYRRFPIYSPWSALLNAASWQLPVLLIGSLFSTATAGFYSLGFRILQIPMNLIGKAISKVLFQRIASEKNGDTVAAIVEASFRRLLVFSFLPNLALALIGKDLFGFVFGENWHTAGVFVQILAPWTIVWLISSPLSTVYIVLEKQKELLILQLVIFSSRILAIYSGYLFGDIRLSILLFSFFGVITYGYLIIMVFRYTNAKFRNALRPVRSSLLTAFLFAIAIAIIKYLVDIVFITILTSILTISVYFILYRKQLMGGARVAS